MQFDKTPTQLNSCLPWFEEQNVQNTSLPRPTIFDVLREGNQTQKLDDVAQEVAVVTQFAIYENKDRELRNSGLLKDLVLDEV